MNAIVRSNDAWGQALDDIYHLIKIQEKVAKELSIPVGVYTHFAMSYHIYVTDLIKARLYLRD
jgi:thymidylate synthase